MIASPAVRVSVVASISVIILSFVLLCLKVELTLRPGLLAECLLFASVVARLTIINVFLTRTVFDCSFGDTLSCVVQ